MWMPLWLRVGAVWCWRERLTVMDDSACFGHDSRQACNTRRPRGRTPCCRIARAQRTAQQRALPPVDYRNGRKLLGPAARPAADRAKEIQRRAIRH